jgi:antibiotic biosynthesis monooxygenase (ABM) superfamily enzyme
MSDQADQIATVAVSRAIKAGREADFDRWADRLDALAHDAPGYMAGLRLGQTQGLQHLVFRFRTRPDAEAWQAGAVYRAHSAKADDFSVGLDQLECGDPVRIELPSDASASKWKRFVTTWIAVFPILLAISTAVRALLKDVPPPLQLIPSSLLLTAALQWIVLPRLQRWSRFWVLKNVKGDLRTG